MAHAPNQELVNLFQEFYRQYYSEEVAKLAREYPRESKSLELDWRDLYQMDPGLADDYINHPDQLQEAAEEALRLYDPPVDVSLGQAHVRVYDLEDSMSVRNLAAEHLNTLVSIIGTVDTAYSSESVVQSAVFVCQRCGAETEVPQGNHDFQEPYQCESCERQGPFKLDPDRSEWVDEQRFELRESPVGETTGDDIESVIVRIHDDLAGEVEPGDQLTVVGVVRATQPEEYTSASIGDKYIEGSSIRIAETLEEIDVGESDERDIVELSDREDIYERMVASVAPSVHGNEQLKLALLLQLFGGVTKELPDESRIRGDIHTLIMGDPGTAKTRLLKTTASIAPKALRTNGKRTTSAGLTTAATRTSDGTSAWELSAGPVVLADQGHLCIDDLDRMDDDDRAALLEPMEEQTVTASKGDANEVLRARTSIAAAANPKYGRFDSYKPLAEQVDLDPALISRFDLIFTMKDEPDSNDDGALASHLLDVNHVGELRAREQNLDGEDADADIVDDIEPAISPEFLRKYIAYARRNCYPSMTNRAKETIEDFYTDIREHGDDEDSPVPVTARTLEGLVRLAEASARMRLSDEVQEADADRVIAIVRDNLRNLGVTQEIEDFDPDSTKSGTSKTQRDRVKNVKSIIAEIENRSGGGAPVQEILDRAEEVGMNAEKVEHEIDKLKQKGELYHPNPDTLRVI
jgi:replicative DNA helicase Mcm